MRSDMLNVAGVVPFTTIDFPNNLAAVVFFKGCPLRCPFCHNPNLQEIGAGDQSWDEVLAFLKERTKRLDGVVLSGGEPLMQPDILTAVQDLKVLGFKVAIHTSGVYPEKLKQLVPFLDWVGLDIKAPWDKYDILSGRKGLAEKVQESVAILLQSGILFETRTTCDPRYLDLADIDKLSIDLRQQGVSCYAMQKYRTFDADKNPPSISAIESFFTPDFLQKIGSRFDSFTAR